ncbi:DEAD/DEAH box helicase [Yinghuangia sp. ASG 101]|uniref:DEAD/DEAH box helicase n=1 Tax=Yinghuangia sp. ASG 101 TaxID=2896848 RepID=UPI001E3AE360|nr:DEAD/DEAH box helicase [Yinghuangia sp. ASG 101]UGQ14408.1 DEAD/DEAH box helicase [Yinghuangia sp. ASG 101]
MTLPVALAGSDVIGQAKTGTGKTLGFGIPLLQRVVTSADVDAGRATAVPGKSPQALVVVPTRELCVQVTNDLLGAGKIRSVRVLSVYGGRAYEPQVDALRKGVEVVVGTPGRLLDLAGQGHLDLSQVRMLVLDEADEMLDLGFLPDVEKIVDRLPARRQTMLFSATMPGQIITLARRYMNRPTHIRASAPDDQGTTVASVAQHVYRAHAMDKPEMLSRILQAKDRGLVMVFCRTKRTCADLAESLAERGFAAAAVHGDLGQGAREQALRAFRNGKVDVLVATDVAARGIDVDGVTHVVNYQCPEDEKTYLHRIGRTGRAGASGVAVTLVDWEDMPRWGLINKALDLAFPEPPETYSTSSHLYDDLGIPESATGVLPRADRTRAGLGAEAVEDLGETGKGGRGRSGTGSPRSGGRGRGGSRTQSDDSGTAEPSRRRAPGSRRRRRLNDGAAAESAGVASEGVGAAEGAAEAVADAAVTEAAREPKKRTRTRTRSRSTAAETVTEGTSDATATAPPAPAEADASAEPAAPRRRRRRRRPDAATGAAETERTD